jgi:16S rRNA (adenine1518-N6/adenine1519-N6)-dimethyltransferase
MLVTKPKKHLGQHFLTDHSVCQQMIDAAALCPSDLCLEIGPGRGALTQYLLPACKQLTAIEIDPDCTRYLEQQFPTLKLVKADVLSQPLNNWINQPVRLFSNLPYHCAVPIILHVARTLPNWIDGYVMVQKEMADRMLANPGSKTYGRWSVLIQALCQVEKIIDVGPGAFHPPPKVWSTVLTLTPKKPLINLRMQNALEAITQIAFSQRRKCLKNTLGKAYPSAPFEELSIDLSLRPEQISVKRFLDLTHWQLTSASCI